MKSNALRITRDSIRIFVPLRPLYGVPAYPSAGGDAHIAPCGKCAGVRAGRIILPTTGCRGQHSAEAPATKEPPMGGSVYLDQKNDHPIGWSFWQGQKGSNSRHAVLETAALPTELYPYVVGLRGLEPGTGRL